MIITIRTKKQCYGCNTAKDLKYEHLNKRMLCIFEHVSNERRRDWQRENHHGKREVERGRACFE
eukprot:7066581-Ditylum_brightwellii.AAC.1